MPGMPGPVAAEREGLLAFLAHQRYLLRIAAYGLTEEQARTTPSVSTLSIGGLVKHLISMERGWIDTMLQRQPKPRDGAEEDYHAAFRLGSGQTLTGVLEAYHELGRETEGVVRGIANLDQPVPAPKGVPWFPQDVEAWSVRWVLLHLIEETARHAGHADIVRESVDGATAIPLMAAVENWPATPWVQPWQPPST